MGPRYDMVKNACYITSKRDVVAASNTVPELVISKKRHPPKEDRCGKSKFTGSCSSVLLALFLCISILLAISSLAVAIFAVVNVRSLLRQCMRAEGEGCTQEVQGTVRQLFDEVNRTQAQVRVLAGDVEQLTAAQSNINRMIMEANGSIGGLPGAYRYLTVTLYLF